MIFLGTLGIVTAMSAGYVVILKMCGGEHHITIEENQQRYEAMEKKREKKKKEKFERDKKVNNYVFDK